MQDVERGGEVRQFFALLTSEHSVESVQLVAASCGHMALHEEAPRLEAVVATALDDAQGVVGAICVQEIGEFLVGTCCLLPAHAVQHDGVDAVLEVQLNVLERSLEARLLRVEGDLGGLISDLPRFAAGAGELAPRKTLWSSPVSTRGCEPMTSYDLL